MENLAYAKSYAYWRCSCQVQLDDDVEGECGEVQNMAHLTICGLYPSERRLDDLRLANTKAVDVARFKL